MEAENKKQFDTLQTIINSFPQVIRLKSKKNIRYWFRIEKEERVGMDEYKTKDDNYLMIRYVLEETAEFTSYLYKSLAWECIITNDSDLTQAIKEFQTFIKENGYVYK